MVDKKTGKDNITFRMYPHEIKEVDDYCKKKNISRSDFLRNAVKNALNPIAIPISNDISTKQVDLSEINGKINEMMQQISKISMIQESLNGLKGKFPSKLEEIEDKEAMKEIIDKIIEKHMKSKIYTQNERGISTEKIIEESKLKADQVFDFMTNTEYYKRINGGWIKNE